MQSLPHRYEEFGLRCWHGSSVPMERVHSHIEIEFNLLERGSMRYRFGAQEWEFEAGHLYVFSGIEPHRLVSSSPDARCSWLTLPASLFTSWRLPATLTERILSGAIVFDDDPVEIERDPARFQRWRQDLDRADPRYLAVILLEVQARLARLALSRGSRGVAQVSARPCRWSNPVSRMLACILGRLTDPDLDLAGIAESARLNPSYASTLFSREVGLPPIGFLTQQRLAYARFLLATSEVKVLDAALASGFGSSSQFYACFRKHFGHSPSDNRAAAKAES